MRLVLFVLLTWLATWPALAQSPVNLLTGAPAGTATQSDSVNDLVRILEDDQARQQLIDTLRAASQQALDPHLDPDANIVRRLADTTSAAADGVVGMFGSIVDATSVAISGFDSSSNVDWGALSDAGARLIAVLVALIVASWIGRGLVEKARARLAVRAESHGMIYRVFSALFALVTEAGAILVTWALGYLVASTLQLGQGMALEQSLLINAFVVVELAKCVVKLVLSPRHQSMRLLPVDDNNANYWSAWINRLLTLLGYAFLFVAPVVAVTVAPRSAAAIELLVTAVAAIIGIIIILQNKQEVRSWLERLATAKGGGTGFLTALLARYWHGLAIIYLSCLWLAWLLNPGDALPFMLGAMAKTVLAIALGLGAVELLGRFVNVGVKLPPEMKARLPLLEARLSAFVPGVMGTVRGLVVAGVVIFLAQAWGLFDFASWISSPAGVQMAAAIISVALILLICAALHVIVASWVEYRLNTDIGKTPTAREVTLLNLFKNAFTVCLAVVALMLSLAQIGVNIAPLLAGAGVLGLAIGFGSQKLVQDIITGVFIQFENVMNEGDVIEAAGKAGTVERLTIRSVTIRDLSGTVHVIPFSSVDQVSNKMKGFSVHVAEFEVTYDSDIAVVKQALFAAFDQLMETEHGEVIIDALDMHGIVGFSPSSVRVRCRIKTLPGKQWAAGRMYSELVKVQFAERRIAAPYPRVAYVGSENPPHLLADASAS